MGLSYAKRRALGICVTCREPATVGIHCAKHHAARLRYEASRRKVVRDEESQLHTVDRDSTHPSDADRFVPRRRLVTCRVCCDLAHRRPSDGCPSCGGAWAPLPRVRADSTSASRDGRY